MTVTIDKASFKKLMEDTESKQAVKSLFKEILLEEPAFFKEIISEILEENQMVISDEQAERRTRLKAATKKIFGQYDEVFKALA